MSAPALQAAQDIALKVQIIWVVRGIRRGAVCEG